MTGVLADERMRDVDALVWSIGRQPRLRTTIGALARFSAPLDPAELRRRVDCASRVVHRLRQRVVTDRSGLRPPYWSVDPTFCLSFHLRTLRLSEANDRELTAVVRDLLVQPFDPARPLWEFTHICGLEHGGSALLLKSHHAVTDGVGGVEMMLELFDLDPVAEPRHRPVPAPPLPAEVLRRPSTLDAASAGRKAGEALGSVVRLLRPLPTPPVVSSARSDELDIRFFSRPLDDLRAAGRRVDGTVNDAFVTAVALGLAEHFGSDHPSPLRISIPVSTRSTAVSGPDGLGSNHWAPGRIAVDLSLRADLVPFMRSVRTALQGVRQDPALRLLSPIAAVLSRLPPQACASLFSHFSNGLDVAASNVPGSPVRLHLGPHPVEAMIPFGPLSGCAVNVTLMTHADTAHIGISSDPAVIDDPDTLLHNLEAGFAAVRSIASEETQ